MNYKYYIRLSLFTLLLATSTMTYGKDNNPYSPVSGKLPKVDGYKLVWNDEFNKTGKLDTTYWNHEIGFLRNQELQWYQPDNAFCKKGVLRIEGRRQHFVNPNYKAGSSNWKTNREFVEYTAASVTTRAKVQWVYGRVEVRARIPFQTGAWPAIWTLGTKNQWPSNGEIDLLELYLIDGKASILANLATGGEKPFKAKWFSTKLPLTHFTDKDAEWTSKFHTWRMDWDETFVRLFLDDVLLNEIEIAKALNPDGSNPFAQEHYLLLNLALGGNGGDPSNTSFPMLYEIDYVRLYQKTDK